MDSFAIRNLPEKILLDLKLEDKHIIFSRIELLATFSPTFLSKLVISHQRDLIKREAINPQIPREMFNLSSDHINKLA